MSPADAWLVHRQSRTVMAIRTAQLGHAHQAPHGSPFLKESSSAVINQLAGWVMGDCDVKCPQDLSNRQVLTCRVSSENE